MANRPPTPRRAKTMAVEKSRYKKGMFLIGPDHSGLGIVMLIVTAFLISAVAVACRSQVVVIG